MEALNRAIRIAGGVTKLANKLRVEQSRVSQWKRRKRVPALMVIPIERVTKGMVTRSELRPDIYPKSA